MRILMISDVYFPRVNGVSTSIQTFRRELSALGHDVTLVAPAYGTDDEADDRLLRIPSRRVLLDPEDRMMKMGAILRHAAALRERRFDVIHVQTPFVAHYTGVRLARRLNLPCVETYHTFFEEYLYNYVPGLPKSWMRALARGVSRAQCNKVDAVVVPSSAMADKLRAYGIVSPMAIIPTGIDSAGFESGFGERFRAECGIALTRPVLVYVGRVAHEKNIGFLLKMLERVRRQIHDVLLLIAGEGPASGFLKKQVARMGLTDNVQFVGYLARDGRLQDCYCAGDAFVFASGTETQGLVLLEAMALGVPVVSTAVMGTRDILEAGRGCLVARADPGEFAGKVLSVLRDADLRQRLSDDARAHARTWSAPVLASRMANFYAGVVARRQAGVRPIATETGS